MTTYYVGIGGSDAADGLSWANRKLTLNGAEDIPVAAGDTVYVGPGTYREALTCDVSGTAGNPITYIADYTGNNTDGTGGPITINGSDNDQTTARNNCIIPGAHNYRAFHGFAMVNVAGRHIEVATGTHWTIDKCFFGLGTSNTPCIVPNTGATNWTISRCIFRHPRSTGIQFDDTTGTTQNGQHVVENCVFDQSQNIRIDAHGGITIRNCTFISGSRGVQVATALPASYTAVTVNNCIITGCTSAGLQGTATGEIVEDYNTFFANQADRTNTATGANSLSYAPSFDPRAILETLHGGSLVTIFDLVANSALVELNSGTGAPSADMRGTTVQGTYREWGALEYDSTLDTEAGAGGSSVYRRVARLLGG